MPNSTITYDGATNTFRDPDGRVLVDLSAPQPGAPSPTNDLSTAQQAVAAAFGYAADATPDILRVECGGAAEEDTISPAHLDITAAFSDDPEQRA